MRRAWLCALALPACVDFDGLSRCYGGDCGPAVMPCFKTGDHAYRGEVLADLPGTYLRFGETIGPAAVDETGQRSGTYSTNGIGYAVAGALAKDVNTAITVSGDQGVGVTVPASFDFTGTSPFTVELWARQTAVQGFGFTVDHENWAKSREGWVLLLGGAQGGGIGFERRSSAGAINGSVVNGPDLPLDSWHHVVTTYDGRALAMYFDGKLEGYNETTSDVAATGMPWLIGNCIGCGSTNGFIGALDEVALYDHAIEECRVSAHYAGAK